MTEQEALDRLREWGVPGRMWVPEEPGLWRAVEHRGVWIITPQGRTGTVFCVTSDQVRPVHPANEPVAQVIAEMTGIEAAEMARPVPTRVVLYSLLVEHEWRPVAEFTFTAPADIQLTVHDHEHGGSIAEKYFDRGVPNDRQQRLVTRGEPEVFMRTLLQPQQSTYYRWADESGQAGEPGPG